MSRLIFENYENLRKTWKQYLNTANTPLGFPL